MKSLSLVLLLGAAAFGAVTPASACACCSDRGQRHVETATMEGYQWAEVERMKFGPKAELFTGPADTSDVSGIANADSTYAVTAKRDGRTVTFTFKGAERGAGSLTLTLPEKVSFFEVDTRDTPDNGLGPALYKEWKFTGEPEGTGDFAAGAVAGQHLTLILQGHGNNCVTAEDFTHWTLVMEGAKGAYTLFGDMAAPE